MDHRPRHRARPLTPRLRRLAALLTALTLFGGGSVAWATAASAGNGGGNDVVHKSYVCKYVGTPGVDERLQTGQNPIYVDNHSLTGKDNSLVNVGDTFSDKQGSSVVIVANTDKLDPEPTIGDCPAPQGPPPQVTTSVEDKQTCDGVFERTTTTTTPYVLVDGTWVLDAKNATTVSGDWVFVRYLTAEEQRQLGCTTTVTPAAPTFTDATCENLSGSYTIPSTPGVDYQVNGTTVAAGTYSAAIGTTIKIKAVAQTGYVLEGTSWWSHKFRPAEDCERSVVPKAPTVVASECANGQQPDGSYTIPWAKGVGYKVDGTVTPAGTYPLAPGAQVTIIAFPKPGFTFGEDAVHSWTLSNPKLDCSVTQPPATLPEVIGPGPANPQAEVGATCANAFVELKNLTPQTTDLPATFQVAVNGTAWKTVTLQAGDTEKLVYKPTSNPYTVTVTADGMATVTGTTKYLNCVEAVVIPGTKPPAVEPTVVPAELPHTGASGLPLALAGAGLLLLGTVLVASTYRRRGDLAA